MSDNSGMSDWSSVAEPKPAAFGAPYPPYDAPSFGSFAELVAYLGESFPDRVAFERADGGRVTYRRLVETVAQVEAELAREATGRWVDVRDPDPVRFAARYLAATASGRCAVLCPLDDARRAALESATAGSCNAAGLDSAAAVPESVRTVVASSGTSSDPKAVMLSAAGILADLTAGLGLYRFADGARYAKLLPYTHAFGLVCDLLAPLVTGGTVCLPHSPATFAAELPRMSVDALNLPPRAAGMLAQALDGPRYRLPTLKKILCGGAGLASALTRRLRAQGVEAFGCYGLTECSPCVTVNRDAWRKDGSCGVALACNEVAVAPDDDSILVRGVNVMTGYLGRPDLTAARLSTEGWLRTGDVGRIDGDGFLYVDGRADDLIVLSDGTKVSPEPLERALQEHPAVTEALVFGAGEEGSRVLGCRLVLRKLAGTEADVATDVKADAKADTEVDAKAESGAIEFARSLRSPQGAMIELVEVSGEPLPRTPAGKIRRNA